MVRRSLTETEKNEEERADAAGGDEGSVPLRGRRPWRHGADPGRAEGGVVHRRKRMIILAVLTLLSGPSPERCSSSAAC